MTDPVRVFVDERPVEAPAGATVAAAGSGEDTDPAAALPGGPD